MTIELIILDFDGTVTDSVAEAEGFTRGYKIDLTSLMGISLLELEKGWSNAEQKVMQEFAKHGIKDNGIITAPPVDPYLIAVAISQIMMPELSDDKRSELFHENYKLTRSVFRPEAKYVLEELGAKVKHLYIVTNSATATVSKKLAELNPSNLARIKVYGDAKKYLLSDPKIYTGQDSFTTLPKTVELEGLDRPVYVKRGNYFDVLQRIWEETGKTPDQTLVAGDIFELDLLLPAMQGTGIHLVRSKLSLPYETKAVESFGGKATDNLEPVLEYVK